MSKIDRTVVIFRMGLYSLLLMTICFTGCSSNSLKNGASNNSISKQPQDSSAPNTINGENAKKYGQEVAWENLPQIVSLDFTDMNTAWLVTYKDGELLRTEDGGRSWNKILPDVYDTRNKTSFSQVSFVDPQRGWAVNVEGQVWRTINGGREWTAIGKLESADPDWDGFTAAEQIKFTDELHGWIIETFSIWRTEDGGVIWSKVFSVSSPRVKGQPVRGFFLNDVKAWICGTDGEVYRTADGGMHWQIQTLKNVDLSDIFFIDESTGWLSSNAGGQLYRTSDGGETWQLQPALDKQDTHIESIWFLSKTNGWAVARQLLKGSTESTLQNVDQNLTRGILLHTMDGGRTWQTVDTGIDEPFFHRVYFADAQHGWLFSRDNTYRTDDGGKSWLPVLKLPPIKNSSAEMSKQRINKA